MDAAEHVCMTAITCIDVYKIYDQKISTIWKPFSCYLYCAAKDENAEYFSLNSHYKASLNDLVMPLFEYI